MMLPSKIVDLAEVHPGDRSLYAPDPGGQGFILSPAVAAHVEALRAAQRAAEAAAGEAAVERALAAAIGALGVPAELVEGAAALVRQGRAFSRNPSSGNIADQRDITIEAAVEEWASTPHGARFIAAATGRRRPAVAPPGPLTVALRGMTGRPH